MNSLLGLLVQLGPVFVQDIVGVVVRGEEAHVVDLRPAPLLVAQEMGFAPEDRLESVDSKRCHGVASQLEDRGGTIRNSGTILCPPGLGIKIWMDYVIAKTGDSLGSPINCRKVKQR